MDYGTITLFETSWGVCNKLDDAYDVLSSKALQTVENLGDRYWLLGPDLGSNTGFVEDPALLKDPVRRVLDSHDVPCRMGHWDVPGQPRVILVSYRGLFDQNQLLYDYWKNCGVDSMSGSWEYVEPVMFATACGMVIETLYQHFIEPVGDPAIALFHGWRTGAGLLYLRQHCPAVGTVFTLHETSLGKALSASGKSLPRVLAAPVDARREASALGITAQCSMESTAAARADCLTAVSDITAEEVAAFLGRKPDIVTPNGLEPSAITDYTVMPATAAAARSAVLARAGRFLRRALPESTRIVLISGRYEFRNKGIDVFLEAVARAAANLADSRSHILVLCAVMGGHTGVNYDAVSGGDRPSPMAGGHWICTHHVHNPTQDPLLAACERLGLHNTPGGNVTIIFNPAVYDGKDGFWNMPYQNLLSAADMGFFPSCYEPWGYTAEQCAASAVPTVTTDLSGFGLWVRSHIGGSFETTGVSVVCRRGQRDEEVVADLAARLSRVASMPAEELAQLRVRARATAERCSWEHFFPHYVKAFNLALGQAMERGAEVRETGVVDFSTRILTGATSLTPQLHGFNVFTRLPRAIARLRELAHNLWWSWHPECWPLFARLNPEAWATCDHNPLACLKKIAAPLLDELVGDGAYLDLYEATMQAFDAYMARPLNTRERITMERPVAYFSTEYGLHESLPIYSGGLGVLSGDHMKSASDLNIPLIGIGLFYRYGYFRQRIDKNGRQVAAYPENDTSLMAMEPVLTASGDQMEISLQLPGRRLYARVWLVRVGTIRLYLLDSNTPANTPDDRRVTDHLYVADRDYRIRQEILLGMGGVALLEALGILPSVCHMNEGHSAFLVFERIRSLMNNAHLSFAEAAEVVKAGCVFTTHTPVDAGNERFSADLIRRYFADYARGVGLDVNDILATGRMADAAPDAPYEMTLLALRHSCRANGVSRLHGDVSRHMWHTLWRGIPVAEVPIGHITNGVHTASYCSPALNELMESRLGPGWMDKDPGDRTWLKLYSIPDKFLWRLRRFHKSMLVDHLRATLPAFYQKLGLGRDDIRDALSALSPDILIIGFARRFAPYKRGNLLFADTERLLRILRDERRPVILLFAGKAHPADNEGIDIMQSIVKRCADRRFLGRVLFLEDYSLAVSRLMVQGCDVWLNTPRRPYEASGTSGQKAAVNGVLNLSIADGWWCEGYNGHNGWTIGPHITRVAPTDTQDDYADVEALYTLLEERVVPEYYFRDQDDVPTGWVRAMKDSMRTLIPMYSARRMVRDYMEESYIPSSLRHWAMAASGFAMSRRLVAWRENIAARFGSLKTGLLRIDGLNGDTLSAGDTLYVTLSVSPGALTQEEIRPQFVIGPFDGANFLSAPDVVDLAFERVTSDGSLVYTCAYTALRSGQQAYGVRVMPVSPDLPDPLDSHLVIWA